jgi:hypothetical protein
MGNCNGCPFLFQQCVWRSAWISLRGDRAVRFSAADRGSSVRLGTVVGCAAGVYGFTCPSAVEGPSHPAKPSHATRGSKAGRKSRTLPTCRGRGCRRVAATAKRGPPMCGPAGTTARAAEDDAPVSLISEIRLLERTLGTTWDARLSQRIRYVALTTDDGPVARD